MGAGRVAERVSTCCIPGEGGGGGLSSKQVHPQAPKVVGSRCTYLHAHSHILISTHSDNNPNHQPTRAAYAHTQRSTDKELLVLTLRQSPQSQPELLRQVQEPVRAGVISHVGIDHGRLEQKFNLEKYAGRVIKAPM